MACEGKQETLLWCDKSVRKLVLNPCKLRWLRLIESLSVLQTTLKQTVTRRSEDALFTMCEVVLVC